ncbi:MAG TPA: ABC transporter ATP-binding protein [Pirellulales bacterium]|jgi:ATP-binding cassette subfamily B protein|nr:ABC transporter ATP-binding protein [Pirellulales bacterium]
MKKPPSSLSPFNLCRWSLSYAVRRWRALLLVLFAMLLKTGLDVLQPWPMKLIADQVLGGQKIPELVARFFGEGVTAYKLLAWCVAAMIVLFLLNWLVSVAESFAAISLGHRMFYELAADLFDYLQRLSLRFHRSKSVGDSIRRVTTDCMCVSTIVRSALLPAAGSLMSLVMMCAILWQLDPLLTTLSLLVVPYMVVVFRGYAERMQKRSFELKEAEGRLYDIVEQTFSSIPVVQVFRGESRADLSFSNQARSILKATLGSSSIDLQFKILMGLATVSGTALIIWVGGSHVLSGELTVGGMLVFLAYLRALYAPLETLMYSSSTIQGAAGSAQRVLDILHTEPDVKDAPGARELPPSRGHLQFQHVTFGYVPDRPVLHDISLEIPAGQTLAIVGPTGAGKTTLVSLLPRFYDPQHGMVAIDGIDLRSVKIKSLRSQISLVLQETFLFPISIAENIAYARPDASLDQIEAAARAARIHDFIVSLPKGYDTVVGERGATLSGGEKQRLSIARALLKDAPILILDEPTSALDVETESLLLQAMEELVRGRTTLIIAHRMSTVRHADRIAVLEDGRIIELGDHEQLLANRGHYYRTCSMQFGSLVGEGAMP